MARQGRITGRTLAGAAALAVAATGLLAGTASAHVPTISATCSTVTVDLKDYDAHAENTVSVRIGDQQVVNLLPFKSTYHQVFQVPAHTATVDATLVVYASDDPKGANGWTGSWTEHVPVCPPPPTSPPPTSPPPTTAPPTTAPPTTAPPTTAPPTSTKPTTAPPKPTPKPTTPAPKPSSSSPSLAFTGGGSDSGLIAAAGAGVVVVGGALVFMTRRRKAGRH